MPMYVHERERAFFMETLTPVFESLGWKVGELGASQLHEDIKTVPVHNAAGEDIGSATINGLVAILRGVHMAARDTAESHIKLFDGYDEEGYERDLKPAFECLGWDPSIDYDDDGMISINRVHDKFGARIAHDVLLYLILRSRIFRGPMPPETPPDVPSDIFDEMEVSVYKRLIEPVIESLGWTAHVAAMKDGFVLMFRVFDSEDREVELDLLECLFERSDILKWHPSADRHQNRRKSSG